MNDKEEIVYIIGKIEEMKKDLIVVIEKGHPLQSSLAKELIRKYWGMFELENER